MCCVFSHQLGLYRNPLYLVITLMSAASAAAQEEDALNLDFLQGGRNTQAAAFLDAQSSYFPGQYFVDVQVNGTAMGKRLLTITPQERTQLCFSPEWLAGVEVYLRPDFFTSTRQTTGCYALGAHPDSHVVFDLATQTLLLTIPQAGLAPRDTAQNWEFGNNALRLNYNANANKYRDNVAYYGATSLLANIGEWTARGSASLTQQESSIAVFNASKALLAWQSDITLGKNAVSNGELGGLSTYGATLGSNGAMRRQMRGYTPVFSGVAASTARVTLRQGNTTLYSGIVPPGPFSIDDVTVLTGGDVMMTVTENDGTVSQQTFPMTLIQGQLSPGEHEFLVSVGLIDNSNPPGTPTGGLTSVSYGYGWSALSLRAGSLVGQKFTGLTGSVSTPLGRFGAVSAGLSGTQSRYAEGNRQGQKSTFTYAKSFDVGTSVRLAYSLISESYDTLGEYNTENYLNRHQHLRLKDDLTLGFSQPLWQGTSFSLSGWERRYWRESDMQRGLNGSLSTRIGQMSISVAGAYSQSGQENQYSVSTSVSVPFAIFSRSVSSFASVTGGKTGSNSYSAGLSANLTERWSMSGSESWGGESSLNKQTNLWTAYDGNRAQWGGQMSHSNFGTTGAGSIVGSMLYLPATHSVILGKNISDTVAVVNVDKAAGVTLLGGVDKTDGNGNLIVPLSRYQQNILTVDASSLPADTELAVTSQKIRPTGSSVTYLPFEAVHVKRYLLQVRQSDGSFMSPGVWATSESGAPLGFVTNNGVLLINSVETLSSLYFPGCQVPASQLRETAVLQEVKCEN
jgi:outer membrane usher protein